MLTDLLIAIILGFAALFGGVPVSLFLNVYPSVPKKKIKIAFYVSIALTVSFFGWAIILALSEESMQAVNTRKWVACADDRL